MTQWKANYRLKAQRERGCSPALAAGAGRIPRKGLAFQNGGETPWLCKTGTEGRGFTLIELLTVLAVVSIITVVAMTSLNEGLFSQYSASQTMRKLVVAVQEARMRAFRNEQVSKVGSVSAEAGDTFKVTFSDGSHGFQKGDYAAFTGLTFPVGMNGGAYLVTNPAEGTVTSYIEVAYEGDVSSSSVSLGTPVAKNITAASELTIRPRPNRDYVAQRGEFLYDPSRIVVWLEGAWTPNPGTLPGDYPPGGSGISITSRHTLPGQFTVRFTPRGFTVDPSGYRIIVARRRSDGNVDYRMDASGNLTVPYTPISALWVTVTPFGMAKTGRTDYANP